MSSRRTLSTRMGAGRRCITLRDELDECVEDGFPNGIPGGVKEAWGRLR